MLLPHSGCKHGNWGGCGNQNLIPKSTRILGILHKPRTIPACTDLHWVKAVHGKEVSIKGKRSDWNRAKGGVVGNRQKKQGISINTCDTNEVIIRNSLRDWWRAGKSTKIISSCDGDPYYKAPEKDRRADLERRWCTRSLQICSI